MLNNKRFKVKYSPKGIHNYNIMKTEKINIMGCREQKQR